jgi:hypothetical protein
MQYWLTTDVVICIIFLAVNSHVATQPNNGVATPQIGLGSWRAKPHEVEQPVRRV